MIIRKDRALRVRAGFTLIEMMMVIVVIGILAAVSIPAIMGGMRKANEAKQSTEISQLGLALEAFKNEYGVYPPSRIRLREGTRYRTGGSTPDPFDVMSVEWLKRIFPEIQLAVTSSNAETNIVAGDPELWHIWCQDSTNEIEANRITKTNYTPQTYELEGDECLVFFLGGVATILDPATGALGRTSGEPTIVMNGFSKNKKYPATVPDSTQPSTVARTPIFFPFAANRLYLRSASTSTALSRFPSSAAPGKTLSDWVYEFGSASTPNYLEDNSANLGLPSYRPITGRTDGPPVAYFSAYMGRGYRPDDFNYPDETVSPGFQILWPFITFDPNNPMSEGPNPYTTTIENVTTATIPNSVKSYLPESYQIIVAGPDGKFGIGGVLGAQRNIGGATGSKMPNSDATADNFSNVTGGGQKVGDFHDSLLSK